MPSHLDYLAIQGRQTEPVCRAERVRQIREAGAPKPPRREDRRLGRLFVALRLRRPAPSTAPCR